MASLSIDTQEKAEIVLLALFKFKPNGVEANIARDQALDDMTDIVQNWFKLHPEMHEDAVLTGGHIPKHVQGAYPSLSCCGGGIDLVRLEEENGSD